MRDVSTINYYLPYHNTVLSSAHISADPYTMEAKRSSHIDQQLLQLPMVNKDADKKTMR